jgi:GT2 family glycosyltransferase
MSCASVSVVVCSYTLDRWTDLVAAIGSVRVQSRRPSEVVVVVDHNEALSSRARRAMPGVRVVDSVGEWGLSAARNTGVAAAGGEIVAFLDDDAVAAPDWLEQLTAPYADETVVAVGGRVLAHWDTTRPRWMPATFDWVVGCTYEGHAVMSTEIRNPIGANMSMRRSVVERVGGFRSGIGREGAGAAGCEETELCIRIRQHMPGARVWYEPAAVVWHRVPATRSTWRYFRSRCVAEGRSKARVARSVGQAAALSSERDYLRRALPRALVGDVRTTLAGDAAGLRRAGAVVAGTLLTGVGYLLERAGGEVTAAATASVDPGASGLEDHVTVVVATHDRPDHLRDCLESILASVGVQFDVVVVDNAPSSDATARMLAAEYGAETRLTVVREDVPGLGRAHNRALAFARGDIVAFTDDDVLVDRHWLARLAAAFRNDPEAGCVTGRIEALAVETPVQRWLESYAGYGKGDERRHFDLGANRPPDPLFPYTAGKFGSGANMAFRTAVLRSIGGFDELLGAGTRSRGGDDLAAFFAAVNGGHRLVYEPAAVVHHRHSADYDELRRGVFGYGVGLTAYLTKTVFDRPETGLAMLRRIPAGLRHALDPRSPKNDRRAADFPSELKWLERAGMVAGPALYARSRWGGRS